MCGANKVSFLLPNYSQFGKRDKETLKKTYQLLGYKIWLDIVYKGFLLSDYNGNFIFWKKNQCFSVVDLMQLKWIDKNP